VTGVVLHLQQVGDRSNIESIIQHISSDETPEPKSPNPQFNISVLTIEDITVVASGKFTVLDSEPITAQIDKIVLHNIGTHGDTEVAVEAITSAVTHAIMQHLAKHPAEGLSKLAFSRVTDAINQLPVFKELGLGSVIQGGFDTVGKTVDEVLHGIGKLFGGGD